MILVQTVCFFNSLQDQFQIAYSNYSDQTAETAVSMAFIGPALTPRSKYYVDLSYALD